MRELLDSTIKWLSDPLLGMVSAALFALVLTIVLVRLVQRTATHYIEDRSARYRARKAIGFIGYLLGALVLATMFSDRLGRLTVVFGVAGAGIAFALQEVIASIAGWAAVSLGGFPLLRLGARRAQDRILHRHAPSDAGCAGCGHPTPRKPVARRRVHLGGRDQV